MPGGMVIQDTTDHITNKTRYVVAYTYTVL